MERKPDAREPSICVVCAWRETCVKKFSFTGQHCLEYTRDCEGQTGGRGRQEGKRLKGKGERWEVM
jgi:hypothetical protein